MSIFDFFSKKKRPSEVAKDRLMMMLAYERANTKIDDIEGLKRDLIEVVKKYIDVKEVNIKNSSNQELDTLEVEILLNK